MEIYLQPLLNKSFFKSKDKLTKIKICGLMNSVPFQKCKWCASKLFNHLPHKFSQPEIESMYQLKWLDYFEKTRRHVGGKMWLTNRPIAVYIDGKYIGTDIEFVKYISERFIFHLPVNSVFYENLILEDLQKFIYSKKNKFVYLMITIEGEIIGSLLFMLYVDSLPRTCEYFYNFCMGNGPELPNGNRLCYKNSFIHRIVHNRWIQIGDLDIDKTIEGITVSDESYCISHDCRGVLSLSKSEANRSGPEFIVSLNPNPWMNKYFVAFGQLIDGDKTLKKIEAIPTYYESPEKKICITDCGEYYFGNEKMKISDEKCCQHRLTDEEELVDLISHDSYIDSDITH